MMLTYAEIEKWKKSNPRQYDSEYCAMCGNLLWYLDTETDNILDESEYYRYTFCKKCRVIKTFNTVWINNAILH